MATTTEAYDRWIRENVDPDVTLGRCRYFAERMARVFPELVIVRGHAWVPGWGKRGHCWLTAPGGAIVEPTASQFPGIAAYEPWQPGDEVMVGCCMDCGAEIWIAVQSLDEPAPRPTFCSEACEEATRRYLETGEL